MQSLYGIKGFCEFFINLKVAELKKKIIATGRWYGVESSPGSFDPDGTGSVDPARATDPDPSAMDGDPPEIYSDPSANDPDPPAMEPDPPADFCTSAAAPPDVPDGAHNSNFYL